MLLLIKLKTPWHDLVCIDLFTEKALIGAALEFPLHIGSHEEYYPNLCVVLQVGLKF